MAILSNLEPKRVFEIFEEMCAIPHGSTNTKAISDWCVAFGEKLGLEHYQDEANNVILIAPATPGYEDAPAVILQGHVDMVCEKEAGCAKDMDKEGLDLFVDGDLVGAKGTTLGGDDGIAVAMALAALEDTTLQHPRLEVVLTTDEEIGMLGAAVLDVTPLQGRTMLNIDSEEEGIFTVGCAGGSSVFCHLPLVRENFSGETLVVRVSGLVGGHSGVEINKGRANCNKLLTLLLGELRDELDYELAWFQGGHAPNAIPLEARAVIAADRLAGPLLAQAADRANRKLQTILGRTDPGVRLSLREVPPPERVWQRGSRDSMLDLVSLLNNGVFAMHDTMPGQVSASSNVGRVWVNERHEIEVNCFVRCAIGFSEEILGFQHARAARLTGFHATVDSYPGWAGDTSNPLARRMAAIYWTLTGQDMDITAVHIGLETSVLGAKNPDMVMVSTGPDILNPHSTDEHAPVAGLATYVRLLAATLEELSKETDR